VSRDYYVEIVETSANELGSNTVPVGVIEVVAQGPQGIQGVQGVQGIQGDPGDTGPIGPPNVLTIGTVEDGPTPGASISGTSPSQTFDGRCSDQR
jgi:hypothetical protein